MGSPNANTNALALSEAQSENVFSTSKKQKKHKKMARTSAEHEEKENVGFEWSNTRKEETHQLGSLKKPKKQQLLQDADALEQETHEAEVTPTKSGEMSLDIALGETTLI